MIDSEALNLPQVVAEVEAVFHRYEQALMENDLATLDGFFWHSPLTVRFGSGENLYGIEAIRQFRTARDATRLARQLHATHIVTFGEGTAITTTEFVRPSQPGGRQTQVWIRLAEGWRIVSAHVSELPE